MEWAPNPMTGVSVEGGGRHTWEKRPCGSTSGNWSDGTKSQGVLCPQQLEEMGRVHRGTLKRILALKRSLGISSPKLTEDKELSLQATQFVVVS